MKVLVINSGSSSMKYQLIDMEDEKVLAKGNYERIGSDNSFVTHKVNGEKYKTEKAVVNHKEALDVVLKEFTNSEYGVISDLSEITAVGHRVVHG
jgi:acetate kinase